MDKDETPTSFAGGMTSLELAQRLIRGELPPPPVATLVGMTLTEIGPGTATMRMHAERRHANPMGTLHGGVLCDLADAAMGMAYAATLGVGESFTTLNLHMNYIRPIWEADLRADARLVKGGKTVGLLECDIFDERENLVAHCTSQCMTLREGMAKGR